MSDLQSNIDALRSEIRTLSDKNVQLLVAVKYADDGQFLALSHAHGLDGFAENRVQQLLHHWELLENPRAYHWHFIGTLQKNKVKYIIDKVDSVQSVSTPSLALELEKQSAKIGRTLDVMAEVNAGEEESKTGCSFEDLETLVLCIRNCPHLRLIGFMTMGPKGVSEEKYYEIFSKTCSFCLAILQKTEYNINGVKFSMGMSGSYRPALKAGADILRIGRKLFDLI